MKKALLFLCLTVGLCLFSIAFWPSRTLTFSEIPIRSDERIDALISDRTALPSDLLSVTACGETLPRDENSDTWYTPALTDAVTLTVPHPWQLVRTSQGNCGEQRVVLYSGMFYTECIVVETGLPVIDIQLKRFDLDPKYIENWRTPASARILSLASDGSLQWQTDRIEIKTRGRSSITYPKKSYTIFFLGTDGNDALRSPLGLPTDRKFALNSLFEDDSKIRDALAYRLWAKINPDNALDLQYAELLLSNQYYGLYGMHGLPTENSLPCETGDVIYKINTRIYGSPSNYHGDILPEYEICSGNDLLHEPMAIFMRAFAAEVETFPGVLDWQNFVDNAVFREIIASEDTYLQNLIVTYDADQNLFRLTPWDLDQSFGNVFDGSSATYVAKHFTQTTTRHLAEFSSAVRLLPVLYNTHADYAEAVANRYRELRETVFTEDAMLQEAAALFNLLTDYGARARDAARWPESEQVETNEFIEAFIPARLAFLDTEFASD